MTGLEKMVSQILEEADASAAVTISDAEKKAAEILDEAGKKADEIRQQREERSLKYHFFRPFDSEMPLHEHLKQMAATLEKRKSKTRKES